MSKSGGVYDRDPERYPEAKLLEEIDAEELLELVLESGTQRAGYYPLFDTTSITVIVRSRIPTLVIPPTADALRAALSGESVGTRIRV